MYGKYKVNAIIQARMTSTRLPGKTLLPLAGKPVLQHIIERLRLSKYVDNVIVACTTNPEDDKIVELCDKLNCLYHRGSETDVLARVLEAAKRFETDIIVEVTSDCPCIDKDTVNDVVMGVGEHITVDYCSNVIQRTYPRGYDVQAFWTKTLEKVDALVDNPVDRQHVSTWIYKNPRNFKKFRNKCIVLSKDPNQNFSGIRLTLDTQEDYDLLKFVFEAFNGLYFSIKDVLELFATYPELPLINSKIEQKSYYDELRRVYNV